MSETTQYSSWIVTHQLPECFADSWSSAKVLAWKLLDIPDAQMSPATAMDHYGDNARSWWQAVVDILMYGKGWTDLARELRRWRMTGYIADDPVLSFVKNTWGEAIIALECYLVLHPKANELITQHVMSARGQKYTSSEVEHHVDASLADDLFNQLRRLSDEHPAHELIGVLISQNEIESRQNMNDMGSTDSAHLSSHFRHDVAEWSPTIERGDSVILSGRSSVLELTRYEGWYHKLHDLRFESLKDDSSLTDIEITEVNVIIAGLGSLGNFVFDHDLLCFVRANAV
jgi:hypothetical protein